ncbi:flagellar biosynthetic protein FliO [Sphingorhabdus arenilitoris]|uniref:Flagellar protein n=1 Tax=Sphingorhabdus arenilitoris TaxID=1490041 RepID=A0ABV8RJM0_9SPHN
MGIGTVISSILAIIIALALVIALAWGAIWLLKKLQDRQMGLADQGDGRGNIRFVRALPLGQRERVAIIEIDGERFLIGITAGNISLLAHWDQDGNALVGSSAMERSAL